jgi:Zn-dependent alcohol dehydrogenase
MVESGQVKLEPLISHRFPLEDYQQVIELMEQGACIKSVFTFGAQE